MERRFGIVLILCFIVFLAAPVASADRWTPARPFYVLSEDGSRVFHVRPDEWEVEWARIDGWADVPPTGLYYNADPLISIYLVQNPCWSLWEQDFIFSRDMQYFVWIPQMNAVRHSFDTRDATALVFFADGAVQRTYMVSDLVRDANAVLFRTTTAR